MQGKNILLIFTDQQRYDTIAALGNPIIKTPTLDELVKEGVSYTNAFSPCPVCVPARHAMVTGRMPYITDCVDNESSNYRKSFIEVLSDNGYQTLGIGKMHFTIKRDRSVCTEEQDLESLLGTNNDIYDHWGFEKRSTSETRTDDDYETYVRENGFGHVGSPKGENSEMYYIPQPSQLPAELDETSWVVHESLQQLENRDKQRPFFMMTSFQRPHPPFVAPFPWNKLYRCAEMAPPVIPDDYESLLCFWNRFQNRYKYRDQGIDNNLIRTMKAYYYASISFIDYNISKMIDYLKENNLYKDTLIIFTSDHGELMGDYESYQKFLPYDSSARIPYIMRYPKKLKPGSIDERLVSLDDILPTVLDVAGVTYPNPEILPGESVFEIDGNTDRGYLYIEHGHGSKRWVCLREKQYKYTYYYGGGKEELFDMKNDPDETTNLLYDNPNQAVLEIRDKLKQRLIAEEKKYGLDGYVKDDQFIQLEEFRCGFYRECNPPMFPEKEKDTVFIELEDEVKRAVEKEDIIDLQELDIEYFEKKKVLSRETLLN